MQSPKKIAVVGGGIIGVSSALKVLETIQDVQVTLIAEKLSPLTTGDGSAGYWNPYLLGDAPPSHIKFWCEKTYEFLLKILKSEDCSNHGVGMLSGYHISEEPQETPCFADVFTQYRNMTEKEHSLFPPNYKFGVFCTTLYAECTKLIPQLMKRFQDKGGEIVQKKINSLAELSGHYDVVVNCPGVEAAKLVPDSNVFPIRGQVMRVYAPWIKYAVNTDDFYILPNSDEVILGGTHQEGNWSTEIDPADTDKIWKGCVSLIPSLKKAKILREWVGLRPGRNEPRIERQTLMTKSGKLEVVHNYGHGGSGVTLFWGCAIHATNLVQEALSGVPRVKL